MGGLRVGLTGGLGSGKSTIAAMLAARGAHVLSADELGRQLMEPGTAVFAAIAAHFGPSAVAADGRLNRPELARLAFAEGRVEELNAIVHPATIALQAEKMDEIFATEPDAVVVVESALIFETNFGAGWRGRFDALVLVTAPEAVKIGRFVERTLQAAAGSDLIALAAEARRRLARQLPDEVKAAQCDFVIANDGSTAQLDAKVNDLWRKLEHQKRDRTR